MAEHTPTPWKVCPESTYIFDADWRPVAEIRGFGHLTKEQQDENIVRIVRAVNSHDALLEGLKAAMEILTHPDPESWPAGYGAWWSAQKQAIWKAEAAIKLAGGE